jgi:hypothetical protein
MSMLASYGICVTAGSRFKIYGGVSLEWRYELSRCIRVVLPWERQEVSESIQTQGNIVEAYRSSHADDHDTDGLLLFRCSIRLARRGGLKRVDGGFRLILGSGNGGFSGSHSVKLSGLNELR